MHHLLELPAWLGATLVFALPLLEASTFIGLGIPGESAVVFGGVLAYFGRLPLWLVVALASAGAVIGDSIGYAVGARWGERIMRSKLGVLVGRQRWQQTRRHFRRGGVLAILFARFAPAVRTLAPGAAGTASMPYRRFLVANIAGGIFWAAVSAGAGYLAGTQWRKLERVQHWVLAVFLVLLAAWIVYRVMELRRTRGSRSTRDPEPRSARRPSRRRSRPCRGPRPRDRRAARSRR